MAAQELRKAARDGDGVADKVVAKEKLATIVKALQVVLRRYKMSREERQVMIGGESVDTSTAAPSGGWSAES